MKTLVPMAVTCQVHADVSKDDNICGVPGHPDAPTCSLLPVLCVPLAFTLQRHIPVAAFGGGWGSFYVDPKDKCLVPGKERYFKNLETAFSTVRMQCSNKARPSYFLKALGKHPQACCFMDYCFLRALRCQCMDQELMHWGSAGLLWSGTNL